MTPGSIVVTQVEIPTCLFREKYDGWLHDPLTPVAPHEPLLVITSAGWAVEVISPDGNIGWIGTHLLKLGKAS